MSIIETKKECKWGRNCFRHPAHKKMNPCKFVHPAPCKLCGSHFHNETTKHCTECKTAGHDIKDHCSKCDEIGHQRENHCIYCNELHSDTEHRCGTCGGKGHDFDTKASQENVVDVRCFQEIVRQLRFIQKTIRRNCLDCRGGGHRNETLCHCTSQYDSFDEFIMSS